MLDSLDTLLAFALIFTVVSLLITIVVQIITTLLNLRGRNLAWGAAEAFEAIAPDLKAEAKGKGKMLADHLLKDSLLSDSQLGSWCGMAKAVRPEELFDLLHRIAIGKKRDAPEIKKDVITLLTNLGVPQSVFELVENERQQLDNLSKDIATRLAGMQDGPVKEALLKLKAETDARLLDPAKDTATRWAELGDAKLQKIYQKFEYWFETGQERSQEWFTIHARIITCILGIVAAFALQLDTIEIYKLVSSNRELRAKLVAQVKPVIEQGERVLKESPSVLSSSLQNMTAGKQNDAVVKTIQIAATDTPESVKKKIYSAYASLLLNALDEALKDVPAQEDAGKHDDFQQKLNQGFKPWLAARTDPGLTNAFKNANFAAANDTSKADFRERVAKFLDAHRDEYKDLNETLKAFDEGTVKEAQARVKVSSEEWIALKGSLDKAGFELFPNNWWRWKDESGSRKYIYFKHFIGMFFSSLLLSLGAPFWFNTLKSLASLRSSVAQNISDENKAEKENPTDNKAGKAPVTVS